MSACFNCESNPCRCTAALRSKVALSRARKKVEEAELNLQCAREFREREFKRALAELFNEFGLYLEAGGYEGSRVEIHELDGREFRVEEMERW